MWGYPVLYFGMRFHAGFIWVYWFILHFLAFFPSELHETSMKPAPELIFEN